MHRAFAILFTTAVICAGLAWNSRTSVMAQSPFASVKMDLTLFQEGTNWTGETKFNIGGNELTKTVQNLKVNGTEVSFTVDIEGTQVNFTGSRADDKLSGTLEAMEKTTRVATGTWNLSRTEAGAAVNGLAGKWAGTFSAQLIPQQQADPNFDAKVAQPAYTRKHPKVLFDEAHNNVHTASGLYKPFADLIMNDGYTVVPNKAKFQASTLAGYDILVIANAAGPRRQRANPAFTDEESDAVRDWVKGGGSLLFLADHAPMGAAAEILARRFDVDMSKGMTDDPSSKDRVLGDILFSRENKLLADHAITRGRSSGERVSRVVTFTGQSLKGPKGSLVLLQLPATAVDTFPGKENVPAAGRAQGLAIKFGKGRVVVMGEAGVLSAQIDDKGRVFGMNYPNTDNRQFGLNIMHWLSRLLN